MVTILFLSPNLLNGFLNWDDTAYVINNELIKDFSFNGIKNIFTTPEVVSTYAPLTLLSWAIDYSIAGLNPTVFHFVNLLLHLGAVSLVFYLAQLLSKNKIVALITAVLFGIHPMHVEVVGWISARKDLLYTIFFLGSLIAYYFYTHKESKYPKYYYYIACLLFFVLSLLSKGTAVILPAVLFLFDYLKARKLNIKLLLEKLPFILLSTIFIVLSIKMQAKGGAMEDRQFTTLIDSLSVGFYGYFTYLIKVIIPFNLSAYHPYPNQLGQSNPWFYYASAIPILALFTWLLTKFKKNRSQVFGFGFFFITLIPVIQVLSFGTAVTADRYTYLPYVGLFYLIGVGAVWLYNYTNKFKKIVVFSLSVYIVLLGILSFQYSKTFKNGETLWSNVIDHYPNDFLAYMNRADYRISKKQYKKALQDSDKAITINTNYHLLYYNRSFIYDKMEEIEFAIVDLAKAISLSPKFTAGYLNRGILYGKQGKVGLAITDFTKVIQLSPRNHLGFYNRALYYKKSRQYSLALKDINKAIVLNDFAPSYYLRGELYLMTNNINNAFKDFTRVLTLDPSMVDAYIHRGNLWLDKQKFTEALKDYNIAVLLDKTQVDAYINLGFIYMNLKENSKAHLNFELAKKIMPNNYLIYFNKGLLYQLEKKQDLAYKQFEECLKHNPNFMPAKKALESKINLVPPK